ncbi:MAG: hypothetical protein OXL96_27155 [Candidatus Poribacteria bacterium]|nr:hypothetical protein [Candidatus Poribacteria bacterium]
MSRQPLFMYYRAREQARQHKIRTAFNLEFNDENYAIATPAFWDAWREEGKRAELRRQYALAKYPADQIGLQGRKPVWVVFVSQATKEAFEAKHASPEAPNADGEIQGLGWQSTRANTGMFLDDRNKTYRSQRSPVVAWLNHNQGRYSVNIVDSAFKLTHPIPRSITELGDAVDWVYNHSVWVK